MGEGGAEYVSQNVTFGFGLFWTIINQGPADSRKKIYLSLHYLKEFRLRAWVRDRAITRDDFYLNDPSVCQGKCLIIQHLLFLVSLNCPPPLWVPGLYPKFLTQGGIKASTCWFALGSHFFLKKLPQIQNQICFSPVNMFYVKLIIKPVREPRRVGGK